MSKLNTKNESKKDDEQYNRIKKLLKGKNLNPKKANDLKTLLDLTLNPEIKKFNFEYLLNFLLKYMNSENEYLFYEYFFKSCELSKLSFVKILLENSIDINCQNELGETPLHIAVSKNDIELFKLLLNYEPNITLATYKDNLTVMNYAEICRNTTMIDILKNLEQKIEKKREIKAEIIDYINKDMNKINNKVFQDSNSFMNNNISNIDKIQNYTGEKMSIITDGDLSSSLITNNLNKNGQSTKLLTPIDNKYINTQTIINESDFCDEISPKNKKILILNNKKDNNKINAKFLLKDFNKLKSSSNQKDDNLNHCNRLSINPSYIQSLTTCHTLNKDHSESPIIINKSLNPINKMTEIYKFITEINLPKEYTNNLVDNGFDALEVLISQTKKGTALTYNNLKEIGIKLPGERAKILIHLEELAGNFPYYLDADVIYFNMNKSIENNDRKQYKNNSLYKFLSSINLEKYYKKFIDNGYYNVELLFIQINSKQPLDEEILINDIKLNKSDSENLINNLINNSKNYIDKQKKKENNKTKITTIILEENNNKYCEMCIAF
jgi:ankyrin repeat protein